MISQKPTKFALIGNSSAITMLYRDLTDTLLPKSTIVFVDKPSQAVKYAMTCLPGNEINEDSGRKALEDAQATWLISVSNYNYLIKQKTLSIFQGRTINLHFGELPQYAGRLGYQWAIRNGERKTAVVLHKITFPFDSGEICDKREIPIYRDDTGLSVYRRCLEAGIALMCKTMMCITDGKQPTWTPQIKANRCAYLESDAGDGEIDWQQKSKTIIDLVRAADFGPFRSPSYVPWTVDANDNRVEFKKAIQVSLTVEVPKDGRAHMHKGRYFAQAADGVLELVEIVSR